MRYNLKKTWKKFVNWWNEAKLLGFACLLLGLAGLVKGCVPYLPIPGLEYFHQRIAPTLFGIGVTVLLIGAANDQLATSEEKKRLILQMGSFNNAFAVDAARMQRTKGWFVDGTLHNANLNWADLRKAILYRADLSSAHLNERIFNSIPDLKNLCVLSALARD